MKKSATKTMLLVMIVIVSVLMVAQIANTASIVGSKHDLKTGSTAHDNEVCVYCHTPHGASTGAAGSAAALVPLWSRAANATTIYTLYTGTGTLNATTGQPGGVSLACLSCHDGTTAIDAYKGLAGTAAKKIGTITGSSYANFGTSLANDHPVGFEYTAALATADGGLVSPSSTSLVVTGIPLFAGTGMMECASCHNVHDPANGSFLRIGNAGSALCLKCHVK
jgi:predicted CXXCH cytochrome family protein